MAEAKENSQQTQEEAQKRAEEKQKEEAARIEALKKRAIIFRIGDETNIVVAKTQQQIEHSPLKAQYAQALRIVDEILAQSPIDGDKESTTISNIVAFCGDRGEGKTSALMTTREILLGGKTFEEADKAQILPTNKHFKENTFKVLRLIDPAFFDNKHNLLELLIGQMYSEVKQHNSMMAKSSECDELCASGDLVKHKNLIKYFQKVRTSLAIIHKASEKNAYDNLEEIDELAAGIELKENLRCLLKLYADYFHNERVLICIDDLDLNVTDGYQMCEEIRKYLCNPSVCVVLMSIKVEQMIEVVQSYLRNNMAKEIIPNQTITEMAIRYVTKLLPTPHRVVMPKGEGIVELPVIIEDNKSNEPPFESVKEAVVRLIYRKTRYIFVNGRNLSPIVPTNLRSIRHLIGLLCNLQNVTNTSGEEIIQNQSIFKHYFYHTWVRNLNEKDAAFVSELVKNEDLVSVNKSVILYLREKLLDILNDKKYKFEGTLATLLDPLNTMQNVSLGDVFYVLKYIDDIATSIDDKNLVFFLRAYYSILLYDTYNFVSESNEHLFVNDVDNKPSIYKYDEELRHLNMLQRLINGSYFTYELGLFIPAEKSAPREKRVIDGSALCSLIKSLRTMDDQNRSRLLQLCEFFVLTTCYPTYVKQGVEYNKRMSARSYYAQFTSSNNYVVFDVLSIFYNLINVKFTYQRWNNVFGGDFYEFALDDKNDSLLKKILDKCLEEHPAPQSELDENLHSLITEATIRFSEVQLAIIDHLCNHRDVNKEGGNANNIRIVYSAIQNIGIKLYPLVEKNDTSGHLMKFHFLTPIINMLKSINPNEFDSIFTLPSEQEHNTTDGYIELMLNGIDFPVTGKEIYRHLQHTYPEIFKKSGGYRVWRSIFGDKRTYDSIKSAVDAFNRNAQKALVLEEYRKTLG